jgi:tRNA-specific 2-thiouridylase
LYFLSKITSSIYNVFDKYRNKKIKVLIGMSGGVDSSVAAALLVKKGYDVTGAFMKQWSDTKDVSGLCTWKQDRRDAMRVAAKLGIPLLTLDFEKEYKEWVMSYMFEEYQAGRTPNPDVLCNKYIKFGVWLDKARELGFDYLATGHYARIGKQSIVNSKQYSLLKAKDENKDQTYFLHQITQEQLAHTLFPIGKYKKTKVRKLAKKFNLPTADREESMGVCFVGEMPMKDFLLQKIKPNPGKIVNPRGEVLGEHDGLPFYTIGQRSIGVNSKQKTVNSRPLYVVDKNFEKNELVVGEENDPLLYKKNAKVGEVNWVSGLEPTFPLECEVRLRHRQKLQKSKIINHKSKIIIEFEEPQKAVTPGQFAVFYRGDECLGGGFIV